jgi:ankyrin repeat protein
MDQVIQFLGQEGNVAYAARVLATSTIQNTPEILSFRQDFIPGTQIPARTAGISIAAYFGLHDVVRRLLDQPSVLVNTLDNLIGTTLHWASAGNDTSTLSLLLAQPEAAGMLNSYSRYAYTPLHIAILYRSHDALKLLLTRGADILICRGDEYKFSALRLAIGQLTSTDIVTTLLEADKERKLLKSRDTWGSIPLHYATGFNQVNIIKLLLEYHDKAYGADVFKDISNVFGENPLHSAARDGSYESVRALLSHKHSSDLLSSYEKSGGTPFHTAVRVGGVDIVRAFLDHGSRSQLLETKAGQYNVLQLAAKRGHAGVFELLLKNTTPSLFVDENGRTTLHDVATSGSLDTLRVALENESLLKFLNAGDRDGMTPLHLACAEGCRELIEELISSGADLNAKNRAGLTPLHLAVDANLDIAVATLLKAGCMVHIEPVQGVSSTDIGLKNRSSQIVGVLLRAGATLPLALDEETRDWAQGQKWWPGSHGGEQSNLFIPETAGDIFRAAFFLKVASGLPTALVNTIMDMAEYWMQSRSLRHRRATVLDADADSVVYLQSEPIVGHSVRPVRQITFIITSHDQGWSDYKASDTESDLSPMTAVILGLKHGSRQDQ